MIRRRAELGAADGSATVEFAVIAPILILSVLGMAEIGFSVHEAFRIDQTIRNGIEAALGDPGEARVEAVLERVGGSDAQGTASEWSAERRCQCPASSGAGTCRTSTTCSGGRPMDIFYDIRGSRTYEGIFLSPRTLSRTASVQVR